LTPPFVFSLHIFTICSPRALALALSDYGDATDDDDTTWKVRRAAVKVVAAVIVTAKPEALKEHFESVRIKWDVQTFERNIANKTEAKTKNLFRIHHMLHVFLRCFA
jgi:hypothetical protein